MKDSHARSIFYSRRMFGSSSRYAGNARPCCIAISRAAERQRALFLVCETTGREPSRGMPGSNPKDSQSSKRSHPNTLQLTDFPQTSASIPSSLPSLLSKTKRERREPLPFCINPLVRLRQRFDVEKELEATRLLNAKQEAHIDGRAIRNRRRQRNYSRRHRRIESTTIRL